MLRDVIQQLSSQDLDEDTVDSMCFRGEQLYGHLSRLVDVGFFPANRHERIAPAYWKLLPAA